MGESKAAICVRKSYSGGVACRIGGKFRASASSMSRCSCRSKKMTWIGADFFSPVGGSDTASSTTALHQFPGPVHEQLPFLRHRVGRAVRHAAPRPRLADRRAILAGDDQGTEAVDPVFEVVVLGVDVDADEVRVQVGRGHRQGAVALAGDVAEGLGAVLADGAAETPGPVDQFVEPGTDRPGGGDLLDLGLPSGGRHEVGGRSSGEKSFSVARDWTVVMPARRRASFSVPVM